MRKKTFGIGLGLAAMTAGLSLASPVSAQSVLQNTSGGSIQPQTAQTQSSANTQNQVDTLQNNNSQSVLNQSGYQPLGVVSDPRQTVPEAVAQPSAALKTEINKPDDSNLAPYIAVAAFAVAAAGIYMLSRGSIGQPDVPAPVTAEPIETDSGKPKKQKKPKKKRKHPHRR